LPTTEDNEGWAPSFCGFVFRLPSFQQLEAELAQPALQRWIGADRAFHDDLLRYSLIWPSALLFSASLVGASRTGAFSN
jgi:hypothetical protein